MKVYLIKPNKIRKILLPSRVVGNYWVSDTDSNGIRRNLISIEADNNRWKLVSNNEVYIIENKVMTPAAFLDNYQFYQIHNSQEDKEFLLYCCPIELNYMPYDISNLLDDGVSFGSDKKCSIYYQHFDPLAFTIKRENNKIYTIDNHSKYGIYINNVRLENRKEIKNGDCFFVAGIQFIILINVNLRNDISVFLCIGNQYINNLGINLLSTTLAAPTLNEFVEPEEEIEFPLYDENEYFHKMPRFISKIETLELKVDAPPGKSEDPNNSLLMTIGPMITMSLTSVVSVYTTLDRLQSGQSTMKSAMPSLVMSGAMLASVIVWPLLSRFIQKRMSIQNEKKRQKKYGKYIEEKKNRIVEAKKEQSATLNNNYPDNKTCEEIILNKYTNLWQRRIKDEDYLKISLGLGTCPMQINIHYPEDHFSMVEDNLKDMVSKLGQEPKNLENVPIEYSLISNYISGIIGDEQIIGEYTRRILLQLMTFQSYDNLKIILLTDEENEYQWKIFKDLPHIFTDDKNLRFFATNNDEYKEVCYYLDRLFKARVEQFSQGGELKRENLDKIYLIITDCFKKIRDFDIINDILENDSYYGFNLLILDNKLTSLPDQCQSFIKLNKESGELNNNLNYRDPVKFTIDLKSEIDLEACVKKLANIPIEINSNDEGQLPNKLGFLEMYDVGKIEQLNSLNRWQKNNPILNLQVPVGRGKNGEDISIDLHEKYHGPHGLIAGMTGSGKSEFIISYILSMAINYHPYEVQFILIDYKGGGLAGAFENKNIGLKLPHLVGTITNLDANEINRSLASIESELKRRQALFNKAREISGESTVDIYKYQKMYREGKLEEPVSHLFIISDEFAELKNQQPEFMEQLISTARIGRSLGVHLILATQKPSGVVDPQIWSNTRFRVCLRVQEKSDSNEVIKCPDAALLKQTGRFYFQVGYNEVFVLGQAAWAGGKYLPTEKVKKTLDTSLNVIDNIGYTVKTIETREKQEVVASDGEELINLVKYLSNLAKDNNIKCKPLWLEKIPEFIRIEDLKVKYSYQKENFVINPVIGEYDVPKNQEQRLLTLPFSKEGNALVYGTTGSGKENFITTLLYSSMLTYENSEVNFYIIDFGSGALKMFKNCNLVGDILGSDDNEKMNNLFKMLTKMIEERKELFAEYNGEYSYYCKNSGKTLPNVIVMINSYELYQETFGDLEDTLNTITRDCNKYGIYFLVTCSTAQGMRYKLRQNFSLIYCLQQNNEDDYTTILGNVHKTYPSKLFGRGIIKTDDIYEFQTALATEKENIPHFIKEKCQEYNQKTQSKAIGVPILPKRVEYADIKEEFGKDNSYIIGLSKLNLDVVKFDFDKNYISLITGLDVLQNNNFVNPFINQVIALNKENLIVFNAEDYDIDDDFKNYYQYIDSSFNENIEKIHAYIKEQHDIFEKNNYNKNIFKDIKKNLVIFIGLEAFKAKLNDENKTKLTEIFTIAKDLDIMKFIILDSVDKIKKNEFENWYKDNVNTSNGIWLGNGVGDQFTIKVNQRIEEFKEDVPYNFCFVINRGKPVYVKYLEKLDLQKK